MPAQTEATGSRRAGRHADPIVLNGDGHADRLDSPPYEAGSGRIVLPVMVMETSSRLGWRIVRSRMVRPNGVAMVGKAMRAPVQPTREQNDGDIVCRKTDCCVAIRHVSCLTGRMFRLRAAVLRANQESEYHRAAIWGNGALRRAAPGRRGVVRRRASSPTRRTAAAVAGGNRMVGR